MKIEGDIASIDRAAAAERLGISVEHVERLLEQVEETDRKLDVGLATLAREELLRNRRLRFLEPGRVTPEMEPRRVGEWRLHRFVVSPQAEEVERMRSILSSSSRGRWVPAGLYTSLERVVPGGSDTIGKERWTPVMSDTPDELLDLIDFRAEARGRVLINGLGLGCALRLALAKAEVEHVDVVERSADVIALVAPYYADDPRVEIHEGDAYTYRFPPGTRWNVAWHDIWDNISTDNDWTPLLRRYGRRVEWQGVWAREAAERADRLWDRESAHWLPREER